MTSNMVHIYQAQSMWLLAEVLMPAAAGAHGLQSPVIESRSSPSGQMALKSSPFLYFA